MKKFALLIGLMAIISACSSTYFTTPQPASQDNLSAIPTELQGSFQSGDETIEIKKSAVTVNSKGMSKSYTLGKDLIVKKEGLHFYFNMKNNINNSEYWDVRIISPNSTGFKIWSFDGNISAQFENTQVINEKNGDQEVQLVVTSGNGFEQLANQVMSTKAPQEFIKN